MTAAKRPMPAQLRNHLIDTGRIDAQGTTRTVRTITCTRCNQRTLRALDHHRVALTATCDPQPLTALGELHATLQTRRTYTLRRIGNHYELSPRTPIHIQNKPANKPTRDYDVIAAHVCGQLITETQPTIFTTPAIAQLSDEVPF